MMKIMLQTARIVWHMCPKPHSSHSLVHQHSKLCFDRAFPESLTCHRHAHSELRKFAQQVYDLPDTGIAGTRIHYRFSFEVARWLGKKCPGAITIDWEDIDDTSRLDELLRNVLHATEDEFFDSGYVTTREWLEHALAGSRATDFDWLMGQMRAKRLRSVWTQLYDAADIPLVWRLGASRYSKSCNVAPTRNVQTRENGMRARPHSAKTEIQKPLDTIVQLTPREGSRLVDVAMASLAVRHRETLHFNHANPAEVYLADVGEDVSVAVFGLLPEFRFPLECTMGYLILSNGVPIGYGGSSQVFRQANTGVNIFDEYRGSEAAFLWAQVMRVYHSITGCTRFIANPYQFGQGNAEALKSGAFWFYYRLGYRPVMPEIRKIARRESTRMRKNKDYRSDLGTLRRLASCDMHLSLPGAKQSELFDEEWLTTSSMLATRMLGEAGGRTRAESAATVAGRVARDVGIRNLDNWSPSERRGLLTIAPIVAAVEPGTWSSEAKRSMRELLRAKGGNNEAGYAKLLCQHDNFLNSLKKACRRANSE
jgi:hypothetical protein